MRTSRPLEPRLRRRRKLIRWTILPAIVLVVLAVRLLLLPVHMGAAQEAHRAADGPGMVDGGEKLSILNIVERWRAPFVTGTGRSIKGDLAGGRRDLELALRRTDNPEDDCTVRTNLVLTVSAQADEAKEKGDADGEKKLAQEALKLIEEGPEGCLDGKNDGNGGEAGRKQRDEKDKLEKQTGKQQQDPQEGEDPKDDDKGQGGTPEEEEQDPKERELQERNGQGQRTAEEERRQKEGGDSAPVEKPW